MNGNYFFDGLKGISIFDIESDKPSTKRQSDYSLMNSFADLIKPIAKSTDLMGSTENNSSQLLYNNRNVLSILPTSDDSNNSRIHPFSDNIINQVDNRLVNKEQKLYHYDALSLISGKRYEAPSGFDILGCIPSIPSIINTNSITPPSSTLNMIDNHTDLFGISHRLAQNSCINPINSN